jgi:hypothetical protein
MKTLRRQILTFIVATTACVASPSFAAVLTVSGTDTIFGAGLGAPPGGGTLPPSYSFTAAAGQMLSFSSVVGTVNSGPFVFGPDGEGATTFTTSMASYLGLSGIRADVSFFLVGVFLDDSAPNGAAPPSLDFRSAGLGPDFSSLSPMIGQTFYIGDGRVGQGGAGMLQAFAVPPTATRLFLGIADGEFDGSSVSGQPANYFDNGGAFSVGFVVVPEPSSATLFGLATLFAASLWWRRRQRGD